MGNVGIIIDSKERVRAVKTSIPAVRKILIELQVVAERRFLLMLCLIARTKRPRYNEPYMPPLNNNAHFKFNFNYLIIDRDGWTPISGRAPSGVTYSVKSSGL